MSMPFALSLIWVLVILGYGTVSLGDWCLTIWDSVVKMRPLHCLKQLDISHTTTQQHILAEQRLQLHYCESFKSHKPDLILYFSALDLETSCACKGFYGLPEIIEANISSWSFTSTFFKSFIIL